MTIVDVIKEDECCCSCSHNKRKQNKDGWVHCHCDIDDHYIGYIGCFECVCEEWEKGKGECEDAKVFKTEKHH